MGFIKKTLITIAVVTVAVPVTLSMLINAEQAGWEAEAAEQGITVEQYEANRAAKYEADRAYNKLIVVDKYDGVNDDADRALSIKLWKEAEVQCSAELAKFRANKSEYKIDGVIVTPDFVNDCTDAVYNAAGYHYF